MSALAGAEIPGGIDGVSVLPALLGRSSPDHPGLYWEMGPTRAARLGRWKGVQNKPEAALEVFDLADDPAETTDLASRRPEIRDRLREFLDRSHSEPDP